MKVLITIVGIVLIIFGIVSLGYESISYTKQEKIAEFGNIQVTADTQKTVYVPPIVGGLSLVAGIILVIVGRRNGK